MKSEVNEIEFPQELEIIIRERAELMLKKPEINKIYQSHKTYEEAKNWIFKMAVATLYGYTKQLIEVA
jgi:hypothetical protein